MHILSFLIAIGGLVPEVANSLYGTRLHFSDCVNTSKHGGVRCLSSQFRNSVLIICLLSVVACLSAVEIFCLSHPPFLTLCALLLLVEHDAR